MINNICEERIGDEIIAKKRHNDLTKKNLLIVFSKDKDDSIKVSNMHKAWPKIKEFFKNEENIGCNVKIFSSDGNLLNDIYGNKTKNGRLWLVDLLHKKKNKNFHQENQNENKGEEIDG